MVIANLRRGALLGTPTWFESGVGRKGVDGLLVECHKDTRSLRYGGRDAERLKISQLFSKSIVRRKGKTDTYYYR